MELIQGKTFRNETVDMTNKRFVLCTFVDCDFSGYGGSLERCFCKTTKGVPHPGYMGWTASGVPQKVVISDLDSWWHPPTVVDEGPKTYSEDEILAEFDVEE